MLQHAAPLTRPADVAWFLASYARDALATVERAEANAPLFAIRASLEQALGITFQGERGEHFFRSSLVQTLFYGIFSAWVLWERDPIRQTQPFEWRLTPWLLHVPLIRALFERVATRSQLSPLGLEEKLDRAAAVLNRVQREPFFANFEESHAVQYFYEPFLENFDPELRRELGVWYTPPEIVRYMVARVDTVLKEHLNLPDGLADPRVYVLDPATGTGAYLVEVLRHIAATLAANGGDALLGEDLKRIATERIFGFELLPAPFVVAHLQIGLLLQSLGAPLDRQEERVSVYLTNALTGWADAGPQQRLLIPELEDERDAAERIKQDESILVILGNPPYNGYARLAIGEERDLTAAYRTTRRAPPPQGQGLNDLYVRFFRMAERRIVEKTGRGVVCFISNYSWLDGLSFTGMRERYLEAFDHIWIDNLNGDKYRTGKVTPEGEPDPSVFSTEWNREGIQVGTAITLLVRDDHATPIASPDQPLTLHPSEAPAIGLVGAQHIAPLQSANPNMIYESGTILYRELWGRTKRNDLLATAHQEDNALYHPLNPPPELGYPFMLTSVGVNYLLWPLLPDLFPTSFPGVQSKRDDLVIDIDRARLVERMQSYFNPNISDLEMAHICPRAMEKTNVAFNSEATRRSLVQRGFLPEYVVKYCFRPFDRRWIYWEPETDLLGRKSPDFFPNVLDGNLFIEARRRESLAEFSRGYVTSILADNFGNGFSNFFPLYLSPTKQTLFDFAEEGNGEPRPNLSDMAAGYLATMGTAPEELFYHTLAILHAPAYRAENVGALRQDWPRVPLPQNRESLLASSALGREVAALLDPEYPVSGVTTGTIRPELQPLAVVSGVGGRRLNPRAGDLALRAGWGYAGRGGITMPGRGRAPSRDYTSEELALPLLGDITHDIYLNDVAYWRNVPANVWDYTLGGYQVLKKWLSYREEPLLGRSLTTDEAREVTAIVRRIAALLLLAPALDTNYRAIA